MNRRVPGWLLLVLVVAATVAVAACGAGRVTATPPATTSTTVLPTTTTTTVPPDPPGVTTVAEVISSAAGRSLPNGPVTVTVPVTWYGYHSILPVIARQPGWVDVRLAQRPNQSSAWIPLSDVRLTTTSWRLVLSLATAHLLVYKDNRLTYDFPAGIGTTTDPTPTGHYFVAMTVPPPSPAYGAFVLATSAHSGAITDWEGSGDAIIGIHGPIDAYDDSLIGTTGAQISHGCIRLHDNELALLSLVLPGSPLDIVAN